MQAETQPENIVLIEPSEEQAWPCFHIVESQSKAFLAFLQLNGIEIVHPEEYLGNLGPEGLPLVEIHVSEEHPIDQLRDIVRSFEEQYRE